MLVALLFLSALVPNSKIAKQLSDSAVTIMAENPQQPINNKIFHSIKDNYADVVLLGVIAGVDSNNPVVTSLNTRYYDGEDKGEAYGLYCVVNNGAVSNRDYTRYWHGTMIFLRPLLTFLNLNGIKILNAVVLVLLVGINIALLWKKKQKAAAVIFAASLVAVECWYIPFSIEYTIDFAVMLAVMPLFITLEKDDKGLVLISAAVGTVTAFMDFLTVETITLLVPLMTAFFIRLDDNRANSLKDNLRLFLFCGISWGGAYAATFAAKWLLASIATGGNMFAAAMSAAGERAVGSTRAGSLPMQIIYAWGANLSALFITSKQIGFVPIIIGIPIFAVVLFFIAKKRFFHFKKETTPIFIAAAAIPFLRYALLSNHSLLHSYFTYRAEMITVMALLGMVWYTKNTVKKYAKKTF